MDGRSGATRTPRRDGLDAQPPFCPVPGIEGQRQRQRTGQTQTQGSLPGSISLSHFHSGLLKRSRQATTQSQTQRGEGHPDIDRDQMSEVPGIQLDQPRAVQIMRDTPSQAPGISTSSTQPLQPVARPVGTTPGKSYADAAAGSPPASQSVLALDKEGLSKRQAELETVIGTLPDESPLKTELSTQLDSVKEKLKDPRQPGARLDSATAGVKKATARREKAEESLKQAQEALEQPPGDQGHPRTGGCQSCSSSTSHSGNPPAGLRVLVVRRCSRTYLLLPRACGRKGGRARRRASLQKGPGRTLWGDSEPQGGKRRSSARKIGKGASISGFYAQSEFEIWGWVLPGRHPKHSLPERLWQRQWHCSRSKCRTSQRPSASPCPRCREGEGTHPTHRAGRRHCNGGCSGQVVSPLLRGCGGLIWLCSFFCLLAQIWLDISFFAACQTEPMSILRSSCPATMTMFRVPSQLDAAACKPACSIQCLASVQGNASAKAPRGSPLPCSWTPTRETRQVRCTCPPHSHLPGNMTIKETMGNVDVIPYMTQDPPGYQAKTRYYPASGYGRAPGASAHVLECLCACQGQAQHNLSCAVKLPGSFHLWYVRSHRGTSGGYGHNNPLSESSGELSGNCIPSALPVCHLGLPGSAEMADSRMASPAAEPGRLTVASIGMRYIEKNYNTGTQILPGSISGVLSQRSLPDCQAASGTSLQGAIH